MLCSAWQFIMAFENAKGLKEKYFFVVYMTIHNADETMRGAGVLSAPAVQSVGVTSNPVTEELALPVTFGT